MSLLHAATIWGETALAWTVFCLSPLLCTGESGRIIFWLGSYLFLLSLCHICCAIVFLAFLPLFQYVLQWKSWHILTLWWYLLLMSILSDFWLNVSTSLIKFLLPELIRGGVTHSFVGLGWPLALYVCKEVYHTIELVLSYEELGGCSERTSRSYYSCEQSHSYQATGSIRDVFVPGLLEEHPSFAPSGHAKGEFFIFLPCSKLRWLLFLFLGVSFLLALSWFSLALCLFLLSSKDQTMHNLQQFSWSVVPDCRPVSCPILCIFFLYHGVSSHSEKQEKKGWLGPRLSLSTVILICSSYFFFASRNLQCMFKNSCGVFLKILFWIKEN